MPLVVEILLILLGVVLLVLALIGSGISRRLMTIPKMHRTPRIVLASLGVLLLAGGMWGASIESEEHGPSLADLKSHIPPDVMADLSCTEAAESPKGAVQMECATENSVPEFAWYIMFPDVNSMHEYWTKQVSPGDLPGNKCDTMDDYTKGSKHEYYLSDPAVTVGDQACYTSGSNIGVMYTDRRFNIVVQAVISDPQNFSDFHSWVDETSQPEGDSDAAPATPSHTAAARR
ncbi:hypothetical protein [Streptomyces iakyrus]|uniref:hypothetical protein n=1 Tax=Streptomyces iakyrus TaxID=68219 RepID=UPI0036F8E789